MIRDKIISIITKIIEDKIDIITASRMIADLRDELIDSDYKDLNYNDLKVFFQIMEESKDLPIGDERNVWSDVALAAKDREIEELSDKYRNKVIEKCRELANKLQ